MFNRVYSWVADKNAGINITASRTDTDTNDIVTGLENTVTLDGQTVPTHSLPMGGFTHTGVGNATARTNYAAAGQVQDGSLMWGGTSAGTANAQTIALTPTLTAYVAGQRFAFIVGNTNNGATTLNVNAVGAKSVIMNSTGAALSGGELVATDVAEVYYDGTSFRLLTPVRATSTTIASATTTDLSTATGDYVTISGTTTITGFGTTLAGTVKFLAFGGALTLTYDGTSMVLPGSSNITTVAGDTATFASLGSGNWRCIQYTPIGRRPSAGEYVYAQTTLQNITCTFTNSSPVIGCTAHGLTAGSVVSFTTTGSLPTNFAAGTNYYVIPTGLTANAFEVSATAFGTAITAGSAGSGTQTLLGRAVLTSNTQQDVAAISLTAGDWDVSGNAVFTQSTSTTSSFIEAQISTTSGTSSGTLGEEGHVVLSLTFATSASQGIATGTKRLSLSVTTTVYLVVRQVFATSSSVGYGTLRARRIS